MHTLFNTLAAILPLRHKLTVRKLQMRYMTLKRKLRLLALPPALTREV